MGFGGSGGSGSVAGSSDVALSSLANNQVLTYDSSISKWKNATGGGGSGAVDSVAGKTGIVTLVKGDVGLANVDNVSDANKPISTATTTALNGKANTAHTHAIADLTASGTRSATTYLRGDGTWATPAGGGGGIDAETALARANHTGTQSTSTITGLDATLVQTIKKPVSWTASTQYEPGDFFILSSTVYRVINAFTSGIDGPIPADGRPVTPDSDFEVYASPSSVGTSIVRRASDGSATFGRAYSLISPTAATELTNKQYVDEAIDNVTLPARPASILTIVWNGSAWTYRGAVISAQPTDRITGDVVMFIGNPGGSLPTWAVTNDIWTQG